MVATSTGNTAADPVPLVRVHYPEPGQRVLSDFTLWWGDAGYGVYEGTWMADVKAHDAYVEFSSPAEQAQIDSVLAPITDFLVSLPEDGFRLELRPENAHGPALWIEREDSYV